MTTTGAAVVPQYANGLRVKRLVPNYAGAYIEVKTVWLSDSDFLIVYREPVGSCLAAKVSVGTERLRREEIVGDGGRKGSLLRTAKRNPIINKCVLLMCTR